MGSRTLMAANLPSKYMPGIAPSEIEDLNNYLNSELVILSGMFNKIAEGEILKPRTLLPEKQTEGTILLFSNPIEKSTEITQPGIYIFFNEKWQLVAALT